MANNELTVLADIISGKIESCIDLRSRYYRLDEQLRKHIEKTLNEAQTDAKILESKIRAELTSKHPESVKINLARAMEAAQDVDKKLDPMIFDCERNLASNEKRDPLLSSIKMLKKALTDASASIPPQKEKIKTELFQNTWRTTNALKEVLEIIKLLTILKKAVIESYTEYYIRKNGRTIPNTAIFDGHNYITPKQIENEITARLTILQKKFQPIFSREFQIVHSDAEYQASLSQLRGATMVCNDLDFEKLPLLVSKDPQIIPLAIICGLYSTHFFEESTTDKDYSNGPYSISVTMKRLYLLLPILKQTLPAFDFEEINRACKALWDKRHAQFTSLVNHLLETEGFSKYYDRENMWKD